MKILVILGLVSLSACSSTSKYVLISEGIAKEGLSYVKDDENNTICHIYKDSEVDSVSMTCMKQDPFKNVNINASFSTGK